MSDSSQTILTCYKHIHNGGVSIEISAEYGCGDLSVYIATCVDNFGSSLSSSLSGLAPDDIQKIGEGFLQAAVKLRELALRNDLNIPESDSPMEASLK